MAELQEYTGTVATVEKGAGNSKTYKVVCTTQNGQYTNEKKFIIWPTEFQSEDPNPNLTKLQAAIGQTVTVGFTTKEKSYNNKTWPENTIHEVNVVGAGVASASAPAPSAATDDWSTPAFEATTVAPGDNKYAAFASILDATAKDLVSIANALRESEKVSAEF